MRWLPLGLFACPGAEPDPTPPATCDVTWDNFARGYVHTWCTPCHSVALPEGARQGAPIDVDFDQWSDVVFFAERVRVRATGDAADMPPLAGTDPDDVVRLENWLDCDAPGADDPVGPCDIRTVAAGGVVASQADADAFCAQGNVATSLELTADVTVDCLCVVEGDLDVRGGTAMLPLLVDVEGSLTVTGSALGFDAPVLTTVGGDLAIDASGLTSLSVPQLDAVTGSVGLMGLGALDAVALPGLQHVGSLSVTASTGPTALTLTRLRTVDGDFVIDGLPALAVLDDTRAVEIVGGHLQLSDLPQLQQLDTWTFQFLESIGGDLRIERTGSVHLDGFTLLNSVGGSVVVAENDVLVSIDGLDTVATIGGDLALVDLPVLENVFGLANLGTVGGELRVERLVALRSLAGMQALYDVGGLHISFLGVPSFPWWTSLTTVAGDLTVEDNPSVADLDGLLGVVTVDGAFTVRRNPSLTDAWITPWLAGITVGGPVIVEDNG